MTEEQLKKWLQNLELLKTQIHAWNKFLDYKSDITGLQEKSEKKLLQVEILASGLEILDAKERFVIENHLISKNTWKTIYSLYEDKWGLQNGRSIRTLIRMQNSGINKLLEFIRESELEDIFVDL